MPESFDVAGGPADPEADVLYGIRVTDHGGHVVYDGPAPVFPPEIAMRSKGDFDKGTLFSFQLFPHVKGTAEHTLIALVNAGRNRLN